jgi:hypothetical protein
MTLRECQESYTTAEGNPALKGMVKCMFESEIKSKVKEVVELLVNKDYESLAKRGYISVLGIPDIKRVIFEYSEFWAHEGVLTVPPPDDFNNIGIIEISRPQRAFKEFHVDYDLWIDGKRSDLTLQCDAEVDRSGQVSIRLNDLHVM